MTTQTTARHERAAPPDPLEPRPASRRFSARLSRIDLKYSPYLYIAPFFIIFGIFGIFPLIWTAKLAFQDREIGDDTWNYVGFANFEKILSDPNFWNSVYNTIGIFLISTVPQLLLAMVLANTLNKKLRLRTGFRMGVLIPNITSVAAVGIVFTRLFSREFGLINWVLNLVGIGPIDWQADKWSSWIGIATMVDWRWTGYNALIFLAAMQSIPKDIYESAALDGAGPSRQFWKITVPMLRPTIIFTTIISTIGGLQLYTEPLLFSGGGASSMLGGTVRQYQTVTMYLMEQFFVDYEMSVAATVAWLLFILIMIISLVNYLVVSRLQSADRKRGKSK
ncbi:cellobiose transport system permease protein [Allocatelliglobosispora scoriae]|uniref:Cellobiose transport system permease protein n=1 Tax=Allocatelliglobosispora scoriae TaxID=643052 RepID=A0A841C0K8_9ACTN|nr:sugar ABC transporter permease [Allocatelliglobosispora scoriae]MBB5872490.1 cellobiose transport system permease protein [Allocatelliglobosispora scoriae]